MFWHGGAWTRGDRRWYGATYSNVGIACARAGFVGMVCGYRLRPQVPSWRDQVSDVTAAIRWATTHGPRFGGDPSRIFLAGHSAGAHLVASALADPHYVDQELASHIRGAMLLAGVYDLWSLATFPVAGQPIAESVFGKEDMREWTAASPARRVLGDPSTLPTPTATATASAASQAIQTSPSSAATPRVPPWSALSQTPLLLVNAEDDFALEVDSHRLLHGVRAARRQESVAYRASLGALDAITVPPLGGRAVASFRDTMEPPAGLELWQNLMSRFDDSGDDDRDPDRASTQAKARAAAMEEREEVARDVDAAAAAAARTSLAAGSESLVLRAFPGAQAVWGRAPRRNHITLVALVGVAGDPLSDAMVEFVQGGHRSWVQPGVR